MQDERLSDGRASRRNLLIGMGVVAGASLLSGPAIAEKSPQNKISPADALKRIMDGNARYVAGTQKRRDFSAGRAARASSQHPVAAILSCADSRVAPELIFDEGPGDLFVVRIAGNFATADGLASLEYAVRFLGTPLVMVLGHSSCGAVDAAINVAKSNAKLPGNLPQLVESIKPAVRAAAAKNPANLLSTAIQENVRQNVEKLATADAVITPKVRSGTVQVVGAEYELATGRVILL